MRKFTVKREYENDVLKNITVEGVTLPLGCKVVDYRIPNLNELFLDDDGTVVEDISYYENLNCVQPIHGCSVEKGTVLRRVE
jgi:hypothetical protein